MEITFSFPEKWQHYIDAAKNEDNYAQEKMRIADAFSMIEEICSDENNVYNQARHIRACLTNYNHLLDAVNSAYVDFAKKSASMSQSVKQWLEDDNDPVAIALILDGIVKNRKITNLLEDVQKNALMSAKLLLDKLANDRMEADADML